ncbi:Rieske (2Fe-2S) protein [Luteococcus sp. OSA5]|uniref:Rieske (2Fe-2S) protein n=1 Tax=Luteococcus sp. OSA5 TaxID=3401630 RepID=UPI003B42D8D8
MSPTRRDVIKTASLAVGAAAGAGALTGCSTPEEIEEGAAQIAASEVPVGSAKIIPESQYVVSQPTAGQFKAFQRLCPHAACNVSKVEKAEIICTCHHARFSAEDGTVLSGPAESGLKPAKASVQGDTVKVTDA